MKKRIKNAAAGVSAQEKTADKTAAAKAVKVSKADLKRPEYFFNRELSWLKFNGPETAGVFLQPGAELAEI